MLRELDTDLITNHDVKSKVYVSLGPGPLVALTNKPSTMGTPTTHR